MKKQKTIEVFLGGPISTERASRVNRRRTTNAALKKAAKARKLNYTKSPLD